MWAWLPAALTTRRARSNTTHTQLKHRLVPSIFLPAMSTSVMAPGDTSECVRARGNVPAKLSRQTARPPAPPVRTQPFPFMPSLSRPLSRARSAAFRASDSAPTCKDAHGPPPPAVTSTPERQVNRAASGAVLDAACRDAGGLQQGYARAGRGGREDARQAHNTGTPACPRCAPYLPRVARSRERVKE